MFNRYGVINIWNTEENKKKSREAMYKNGIVPDSRQQRYLYKLIGNNCEYNYPIDLIGFLDIANIKEKICIEYDGGGHKLAVKFKKITEKDFKRKEISKNYYLINKGWKIIRIISNKDFLPSDEMIIKLITDAKEYLKFGHNWYYIDIDNSLVRCSQFERKIELGELRRIKKEDIE